MGDPVAIRLSMSRKLVYSLAGYLSISKWLAHLYRVYSSFGHNLLAKKWSRNCSFYTLHARLFSIRWELARLLCIYIYIHMHRPILHSLYISLNNSWANIPRWSAQTTSQWPPLKVVQALNIFVDCFTFFQLLYLILCIVSNASAYPL